MSWSENLKEKFGRAAKRLKYQIYTTPIEVAIGALLIGSLLGTGSYMFQRENEGHNPIAFSEVGKTIQEYERKGLPVPPKTRFYGKNNDFAMQFLEAENKSFETGRDNETFAHELEFRMDRSFRVHRQIPEYAAELPGAAQEALQSLDNILQAERELPAVIDAFAASWSDSHQDVTHTEYTTTCDSDGKNCTTTSHEVYDYTIHTYTYDEVQGERASQLLGAFLQKFPDLNVAEKLVLATKTDPENEYAIEKSMKELLQGKIPTPLQALQIANVFATGSNFVHFLPVVQANHREAQSDNPKWAQAKRTSESTRYTTYSSTDSGPAEFQIARAAQAHLTEANNAAHKITDGMYVAAQKAPVLLSLAKEYIGVVLDHKPGNANKLRRDMMSTAREIYLANYEHGLDVRPFKWEIVLMWSMIGLLLGGLAGKGVDNVLNKHRDRGFPVGDLLELETWKKLAKVKGGLEAIFTARAPRPEPVVVKEPEPAKPAREQNNDPRNDRATTAKKPRSIEI